MNKELYKLINELRILNEERYKLSKQEANYIIKNNIKDEHQIESILDNLLDMIDDNKVAKLYITLCLYYYNINPEHADDYYKFYLEEINEEKEELKKERNYQK